MVFGSHFQLPFDFHKYKNNFKLIIPFSLFLDKKNFSQKVEKLVSSFLFLEKYLSNFSALKVVMFVHS